MTLKRLTDAAGAPWERPLRGRLDKHVVESEALVGNPLGDPTRRPLFVYVPEGIEGSSPVASIYVIQGFTGQVDMWLNRIAFEPSMVERVDDLFSTGGVPPAIVVFVDAWTSHGGSQYLNSAGTGRYLDYLCDEVVSYVDDAYPTHPSANHRGLSGKSSGGYGAMVVPMLRPDVFRGFATHAGDALFENCYLPEFRQAVRILRDKHEGSYEIFWKNLEEAEVFDWERFGPPFEVYGYALCYSPDEANPGKALLPFDLETGTLIEDVWFKWLERDPVRMASRRADALRQMKCIYIDAGRSDEYYLDLGAQAFSRELQRLGIEHHFELFEGKHGGIQYRYPRGIEMLAQRLG
ncbi:MAG: alpha/beta hydrolase-fold protein [Actinomycetota bacterium]|nr:alpha/beta hydrolase-fold protein [Actinomycetota bacterium]